jgi:ribosomal protein S18 acetylase RimI-like enzyme
VAQIREIIEGQTAQAVEAMLLLRPRWKTADAVIDFIDSKLRPTGYRLVGAFEHSSGAASSIIGFRELWSTAHGHYMYIDDVSTLETARGNGFADELIRWVIADATRRRCDGVHLDSGVGSGRAAAHRLYMRNQMRISAHHFSLEVDT